LFILVDSRLKISLEKKSRQIQAEGSDFILIPAITSPPLISPKKSFWREKDIPSPLESQIIEE